MANDRKKIDQFPNVTPISTDIYLLERADGSYAYVTGTQLLAFMSANDTLQQVLTAGNSTGGLPIKSPNTFGNLNIFNFSSEINFNDNLGNTSGSVFASSFAKMAYGNGLYYGIVQISGSQTFIGHDLKNTFSAPSNNFPQEIASQIVYLDASNNLKTLPVATYPSLAELAFTKGLTSNAQTQLNSKATTVYVDAQDAITLASANNYTDNLGAGLSWKKSVLYSTTTGENLTLTGLSVTVDGTLRTLLATDRILVKNQTTQNQNGLYNPNSGAWTRVVDANTNTSILSATVYVRDGNIEKNRVYAVNVTPITIGTTNITFALISGAGAYTYGAYLKLTGNVFDIDFTTFTTAQITEGSNLYFTNARALLAAPAETLTTIATINHSATVKTTLVDADEITGQDSASSFALIRTTWLNVKAFLKTYFDTIYTTTSAVATQITSALSSFKTANFLDATSSIQTQINGKQPSGTYATGTGSASGTNTGDQTIALTGDITGSGTGTFAATLATVNANVGAFNNVTVNAKGLVTAASNVAYAAGTGSATGTNTGDVAVATTTDITTGTDNIKTVSSLGLVNAGVLKQSQTNIYAVATGTNTYVVSLAPAIATLTAGLTINVLFTNANTTAITVNVNALGAIAVTKDNITPLVVGDIRAGVIYTMTYDGTRFQCDCGEAFLNSPSFTGLPLAPTASALTNNTQIATTAYVDVAGGRNFKETFTVSGTTQTTTKTYTFIYAVLRNNLSQIEGIDYSFSGTTMTFLTLTPLSSDVIHIIGKY